MLNRIKLALIAGGALFAAPAFAEEPPEATVGGEAEVNAGGAGAGMEATVETTGGPTMAWPKEIIDRPLTLLKGKIGAGADLGIVARTTTSGTPPMEETSTFVGLRLLAGYGVSDKIEVGGSYAFTLNEFEIKGPLTLYGNYSLSNDGKLAIGAGAGLIFDFNSTDTSTGDSTVGVALDAGLGIRYDFLPKFAVYTGNPYAPGLLGNHLHLGLTGGDETKTFSFPIGVAMQATPELFAYLSTNLATILLSDPGMGDRAAFIWDATPLTLGAWYAATNNIDVGAALAFGDLQNAGDTWGILLGARYFTN